MDRLNHIFKLREDFMVALKERKPHTSPSWPVDLSDKMSQQHIRDMALRGVEEMFVALQHLKNWKPHRSTEIKDFDRDEFLEEVVDAFNYFLSVMILVGFDADDLYEMYCQKDKIIHDRLGTNY